MAWLRALTLCGALSALACGKAAQPTTVPSSAGPSSDAVSDASRRIYWLAEEQFTKGDYLGAVQLWRHALLQLPKTASADSVRHALVLRIAYGWLAAAETTGEVAPAIDGATMLERYIERHEALFGDSEHAQAERGQVYEILFELEERLPSSEDASDTETEEAPSPTGEIATVPEPTHEPPPPEAGHDGDAEFVRQVEVRRRKADPQVVRDRLESDFSSADAGLTFGSYGLALMQGPRPLLRVRTARWSGERGERPRARSVARALADQAREELLSCYLHAVGRNGNEPAVVGVRLEDKGDHLSVVITGGSLLDAWGDVCVAESLAKLDVPQALALDTEFLFFVQGAQYAAEWNGSGIHAELGLLAAAMLGDGPPTRLGGRSMPPINAFAR